MYVIWFRIEGELPGTEHKVECSNLDAARVTWDILDNDALVLLTSARP